ncbi:uncharacterized protein LOC133284528 isoform X1 [Gastrolobium bilobum]|uniref:uncharacterized protein LOC133284528 isoform X1 n=1 Tax=Gastrolobium bilobum TaxID=150636 RepID=UPI002AAFE72A|nr:uncharacterized protein LOC133284528 isoform X1 [Gastrolobium bilobum]
MDDTKKLYDSLSNAATDPHPNLKDPHTLCETLFDQLHSTFHRFFSALPLLHNDAEIGSLPLSDSRLWAIVEDLTLILRCYLVLLTFLHSDLGFLLHNCRRVLRVLKPFLSVDVNQRHGSTVLRFRNFLSDVDIELSDRCRPFLCAVLEVFADELLRHKYLRRYLMITDSKSSICEKLFACHFNRGDIASVLEVISAHFILSVSNEKAFENFISRLFLHCDKDSRFPGLGLAPAIVLLLDPVVLSAPKMLQAHIIALVSEAIGSGLSSESLAQDMHSHLIAFEKSVVLYSMYASSLQMDGFYAELKCAYNSQLLERGQPTFESYIQQVTSNRLNQVLSKSDNSWDSSRCKISSKTKADLLAEYIAFKKGGQYIFADLCRDMTASVLDCIIHRTLPQDAGVDVLYINENTSAQDIYLLASILKLMSVSLLQAIKCLRNSGDLGCLKTMGSISVHEKYDFLISIINHFHQIKFCLPIQTFLYDVMKSQQKNYEVSKSMLVHFSGLLSLSFSSGLDLLAKGCISVIMALMHLFVSEEGDLVVLESLWDLPLLSGSSELPSDKTGEGAGYKQAIYKVAAEFHRVRTRNLRTDSITSYNLEDKTEETCNGEIFLNCILEGSKDLPDYAELADFIECEKGKNYSNWLTGRQKNRKWRYEKMIELRKIKKETIWKSLRHQKIDKSLKRQKVGKILKRCRFS